MLVLDEEGCAAGCGKHDKRTGHEPSLATAEVGLDSHVTSLAVAVGRAVAGAGAAAGALLVGALSVFAAAHDEGEAPGRRSLLGLFLHL